MKLKFIRNTRTRVVNKIILVVDGGLHLSKLYQYILSPEYSIIVKNNGIDALMWLEEGNDPDLIITSLRMPYLDGSSFIQSLKSSGFYRNTPVMLLSGEANLAEKVKQMSFKVDGFMEKPFNPSSLKIQIDRLIA